MAKRILQSLLLLSVLAGITAMIVYRDHLDTESVQAWVSGFGGAGPLVFMAVYAIATVLLVPGTVPTLVGGALFGPVWGTLYNLTGATIGATLAFLVARYLAADWVERKSGGWLRRLKVGVEAEGWHFVAFVRLAPFVPFFILNYVLGLTRIRLSHYVLTTYIAMLPGALAYTYLGYAGREAVAGGEGLIHKGLLALALLALAAFLPRLVGRLRQGPMLEVVELQQRLAQTDAPLVLDVRSAQEFAGEQGHIPGATNIPLEDLAQRLPELADFQERPVAIVCRTDKRSAKAARLLAGQGFADLHVVRRGMSAWHAAGLAVAAR
jgi:uncharacterized membrane protein YdjX (TVP38/TMEM64 family)/rhodanese-related sulfurtransferase